MTVIKSLSNDFTACGTSFIRLIQEGIIQTEDIEVVAKTNHLRLTGNDHAEFLIQWCYTKEDIKDELIKLVNYLFNKNKRNY